MKGVIFDFDGVIYNTFEMVYELHKKVFNKDLTREELKSFFDGNYLSNAEKKYSNKDRKEFRKLEFEETQKLKVDKIVRENLLKLSKTYKLFIISSNSEYNLKIFLENNNMEFFQEVLGEESWKKKEEKFNRIFKNYWFDPEELVFVTDTLWDLTEAEKIWIPAIACSFGYHEKERLTNWTYYEIVDKFEEISDVIARMEKF